ncbi:MAG: hypothetical protein CL845_08100 [Crocinitomicaceae bacterium]|nr:hypothetical protein [Crocinitomicaceae bacterium]
MAPYVYATEVTPIWHKNQRGPSVEGPLLTKSPDSFTLYSSVAKPKPNSYYGGSSFLVALFKKKIKKSK